MEVRKIQKDAEYTYRILVFIGFYYIVIYVLGGTRIGCRARTRKKEKWIKERSNSVSLSCTQPKAKN